MKGLDTNVLVRYLVQDDPQQAKRAERYIEDGLCYINHIVLCEFVWVLDAAYKFERNVIGGVLEQILVTAEFDIEDRDLAHAAVTDFQRTKADFADCLISRRNAAAGCESTGTFDKGVKGIAGFTLL